MTAIARRVSCILAAAALMISMIVTAPVAQAQPLPRPPADEPRYTAIVMDARTGEVLYEAADSPRYPASITKIMTMYLAFEALASGKLQPTDIITVSQHAAAQAPSKLGLRPGDTITVEDAMHAIAVKSANDMAVALAEKLGGTESRFAALMTLKAQELGMNNTRFVNANGLPDSRQISSARDIAILSRAVMRDFPQYYGFFSQEQFTFRGQTMANHNGLLGKMPGVDGLKTGFTNAAGFNLAASAVRNGNRLIAVVMGGASGRQRNENVEGLLLTGFDIMDRRARGESIMVAQNFFEAPPAGGPIRPSIEQGDAAADPIDVMLTASTRTAPVTLIPAGATQLSAGARPAALPVPTSAIATAAAKAPPAAREKPRWAVQVGAFHSDRDATKQIEFVSQRFKAQFDDKEGSVDHRGRTYRAIFSGFTEFQAKQACDAMKAKDLACAVNGPG